MNNWIQCGINQILIFKIKVYGNHLWIIMTKQLFNKPSYNQIMDRSHSKIKIKLSIQRFCKSIFHKETHNNNNNNNYQQNKRKKILNIW